MDELTERMLLGMPGAGKSASVARVLAWSRDGEFEDAPVGSRDVLNPLLAPLSKDPRVQLGTEENFEERARRIVDICWERFQKHGGGTSQSDDPTGEGES